MADHVLKFSFLSAGEDRDTPLQKNKKKDKQAVREISCASHP